MRESLAEEDFPLRPESEDKHISFAFWNALRRRIARQPRKVFRAKEFTLPTICLGIEVLGA